MIALCSIVLFAQVHGVQFSAAVSPKTVYVGQQVSYDAAMRANVLAQTSFQAPPEYSPPDIKGVTLYDFPFDTLKSIHDVQVSGLTFKEYTYHRAIFPLTPGVDTIPPAVLTYTLPNEADPYAPQIDSLTSARLTFTVLPLPTTGRPPDFTGAVGTYTIAMHPDSQAVFHVGTSFVLHAIVTGTGNIDLLPRPTLTIPWATVVPTTEQVHWDSTGALVHGTKEFLWLVTPNGGGPRAIPALQYSYFNPDTKQYAAAQAPAITVTVAGGRPGGALTQPADTATANTPFPMLVRAIRTHLVLSILVVVLILAGLVTLFVRARHHDEINALEDDEEEFEEEEDEEELQR